MAPHPDLAPIGFLLGTWTGEGRGEYPTIADFTYGEEISFLAPPGKPFLVYSQRTWRTGDHPEAGTALHTETGYLRVVDPTRIEAVIAMPTGVCEIHEGTVAGSHLSLATITVATTPTAKEVRSVTRSLQVTGDDLNYELWMAAVGQDDQVHLTATLYRHGHETDREGSA